ncbi:hypothetical protein [Paranoxybacillus vitaminiphilus]|nr:hypothetical protein [Anoxybacillus vitaminiphilus]
MNKDDKKRNSRSMIHDLFVEFVGNIVAELFPSLIRFTLKIWKALAD